MASLPGMSGLQKYSKILIPHYEWANYFGDSDCKNIRLPDWLSLMWKGPENSPQLLEEIDFRAALDEFAGAEMRFGK
jgi:hypothetical protein